LSEASIAIADNVTPNKNSGCLCFGQRGRARTESKELFSGTLIAYKDGRVGS
jgi:hypothetical protein